MALGDHQSIGHLHHVTSTKKKILFVISEDLYVRNYLRSEVLAELSNTYDLWFASDRGLSLGPEVARHGAFAGYFTKDRNSEKIHALYFEILMWRFRRKSRTFYFRWLRITNWGLVSRGNAPLEVALNFLKWLVGFLRAPRRLLPLILGNSVIFPAARRVFEKTIVVNSSLAHIVRSNDWSLLIFPSAAYESAAIDLSRLGQELKIPTLGLIDNWDNLISKTIFWSRPSHLGVWGPQASNQAMTIHGFKPNEVHQIGTPRFDQYFETRGGVVDGDSDPYILFVGSAMPFDELSALHDIEQVLRGVGLTRNDISVIYRPHPWQQKRRVPAEFNPEDFYLTRLDPQIAEGYQSGFTSESTNTAFQPELDYYPQLFSGARLVIGPLTTMLFEAALCLRPVIALSYEDGAHFTTSLKYFSHFDGLERLPGFEFCHEKTDLENVLTRLLDFPAINPTDSDLVTSEYLYRDGQPYAHRLTRLVDEIIAIEKSNESGSPSALGSQRGDDIKAAGGKPG